MSITSVLLRNNSVATEGGLKDGSLQIRGAYSNLEFPMLYQSLQLFIGPVSTFHFTPFPGQAFSGGK